MKLRVCLGFLFLACVPAKAGDEGKTCPTRESALLIRNAAFLEDVFLRVPVDLQKKRSGSISRVEDLNVRLDPIVLTAGRLELLVSACSKRGDALYEKKVAFNKGEPITWPRDASGWPVFTLDARTAADLKKHFASTESIVIRARLANGKSVKAELAGARLSKL